MYRSLYDYSRLTLRLLPDALRRLVATHRVQVISRETKATRGRRMEAEREEKLTMGHALDSISPERSAGNGHGRAMNRAQARCAGISRGIKDYRCITSRFRDADINFAEILGDYASSHPLLYYSLSLSLPLSLCAFHYIVTSLFVHRSLFSASLDLSRF